MDYNEDSSIFEIVFTSRRMAGYALAFGAATADFLDQTPEVANSWIRDDNISVYDLNVPNRVVRQNYSIAENNLASPPAKRHILGIVGGNDVSRMAGNPQDIESDLTWRTRPLTKCPGREYKPMTQGQQTIQIHNRKTNLAIDVRPVNLPEYQMWAYPQTFAPLPLQKETCGRPEKY
jgi:hypothetical protein